MRTRSRHRLQTPGRNGRKPGAGYGRRAASAAPYLILALTLTLGMGLGVVHNHWRALGHPDPLLAGIRTLLFPFQVATARLEGSLSTAWSWFFTGKRLQNENARLRKEVARLQMENQDLQTAAGEAARLRTQLGFAQRAGRSPLAAEVIGWLPSSRFDTITIARGARDGVKVGAVVRTPDGLLGQVSDVSLVSSQVMLLTDASSGVGARVVRKGEGKGVGIVQGGGRGRPLELVYLKREDDVRPGDRIVSSGYGGVVPPDIPIGKVVSVTEDRARFLKAARVAPAARGYHVREVFLLP
jgi:rod shape-determining protein MreC